MSCTFFIFFYLLKIILTLLDFGLKQEVLRRIQLKANFQIYQLRPCFIMPYMVEKTKDFDKPLYLPTVVANGCFFGIDIVEKADSDSLIQGYSTFAEEVRNLEPNYSPDSVNIDGWEATRNAWKKLFSKISIILCFLHLVLGIKDYLRRDKSLLNTIKDKLWSIDHGESKRQFASKVTTILGMVNSSDSSAKSALKN